MMNEFEGKLEKLTRLTKAFEQADDSNKRSHLANELLCTLENTTLSARRYYSSFLKPEKQGVRRISCRTMSRNTARWRSPVTAGRTFV